MVKLLECIDALFNTVNLYEVLGLEKNVSASEIKKAYFRLSLQVHPDRVAEEERKEATKKFQVISQVYNILSSAEKRALYDECGEIDDESGILEENRDWDSYWRILFRKITIADIEKFQGEYRFSEAEKHDVVTAYVQCEGDMDSMLEMIPCSIVEDDVRFKEIIDEKIKNGDITLFDAFKKENLKTRNKRRKLVSIRSYVTASRPGFMDE